ncbi:tripartite tricarboxylate transporter TctB family protein [Nitratireductor basaltis]|uniref:Tripartite tricarboxylate transporter TctB family protein n=1 Tax=Nitratireductor basaltis TaxID=472175 RepID=A0A084U8R1_9HYPH|nr:tripartite tricarboxylate transporter TctB family protein [Nitratireductor basaltis]KFB09347.1 Tripartite tricarboxylate transporter TctB family protein [Nitratireductor basaltis]
MMRLIRGQVIFALGLAVLNTIYASQLVQMDRPFATGEPGPAFLPVMLCGFVYLASLVIVIREFRAAPTGAKTEPRSEVLPRISLLGPAITIGATALFIVAFVYLGYLVAAACFTFIVAWFFTFEQTGRLARSVAVALATCAVVTLFGWLFFVKLFGLYLPVWEL